MTFPRAPRASIVRRSARGSSGPARVAFVLALVAGCSRDEATSSAKGPDAAAAPALPTDPCDDDRVDYLLVPGSKTDPFLIDTTDMLPLQVDVLAYGQMDPLVHAREQLAALGDAAVPALERFVATWSKDPNGGQRMQNALGVLMMTKSDAARRALLVGLQHPSESVRRVAVKGLARHPDPADYDTLAALVSLTSPDGQVELADALVASDRARAEADVCTWIAEAKHPALYGALITRLARTKRPETLACLRERLGAIQGEAAFTIRAALAASGDAEELAKLREMLRSGTGNERLGAIQALAGAGLERELVVVLESDPEPSRRVLAAQRLAAVEEPDAAELAALRRGMADTARDVRKLSLAALVKRGEADAKEVALELLKGDKPDLEVALHVLRDAMRTDEVLARRALEILLALRRGDLQPVRVERLALDRAIAQVPLREAVELLYDAATTETHPITGISPHRWYVQQIGNTGRVGALFLREKWKTEPDPLRRLDLVAGAVYDLDDEAREFLIDVLADPRTTPCEGLYVALELCKRGPASRVAPVLKRYTLAMGDKRVRPALNALLWTWFAPPH